jgi:tRNA pseudouridine38-40 synthase
MEIAYRGTNYHGWQIQENAHTVQAAINQALTTILRHPIETIGSGRTDTGVHATQQFLHLDTPLTLTNQQHLHRLNALLPADIVIRDIFPVADMAHARFDANLRSYEYRICLYKNPFLENQCYYFYKPLHTSVMNEAANKLLFYTDFQSFSRVKTDVNHFNCQVTEAIWKQENDLLVFHISANRFLRGMVRAIVGTLIEVGLGRISVDEFEEIILSKDRRRAGMAVAPEGLFLTSVQYPFVLQNVPPRSDS